MKNKKYEKFTTITVEIEKKRKLKAICGAMGMTIKEYINKALEEQMKRDSKFLSLLKKY